MVAFLPLVAFVAQRQIRAITQAKMPQGIAKPIIADVPINGAMPTWNQVRHASQRIAKSAAA